MYPFCIPIQFHQVKAVFGKMVFQQVLQVDQPQAFQTFILEMLMNLQARLRLQVRWVNSSFTTPLSQPFNGNKSNGI
jgi:hypothetical protein